MAARIALVFAAALGAGVPGHAADSPPRATASLTPPSLTTIGKNAFMVRDPLTLTFSDGAPAITVPAGFVTELSSVPKDLRWTNGRADWATAAAVLHDYLYWVQACTQEEADAVMLRAMSALGASRATTAAALQAMTRAGPAAFSKYTAQRRSGEVRTFTAAYAQGVVHAANFDANETLQAALRKAQASGGLVGDESASPAIKLTCARLLYQCETCRDSAARKKTTKTRMAKGSP
jgi:hypothetical protein